MEKTQHGWSGSCCGPVSYTHLDVYKRQALRSALRESPDVILLGEMRDYETIEVAMTAAETGQLLFSTLHTTGAANTVDRIIDVFPAGQPFVWTVWKDVYKRQMQNIRPETSEIWNRKGKIVVHILDVYKRQMRSTWFRIL